jgi:hypothetical protein
VARESTEAFWDAKTKTIESEEPARDAPSRSEPPQSRSCTPDAAPEAPARRLPPLRLFMAFGPSNARARMRVELLIDAESHELISVNRG